MQAQTRLRSSCNPPMSRCFQPVLRRVVDSQHSHVVESDSGVRRQLPRRILPILPIASLCGLVGTGRHAGWNACRWVNSPSGQGDADLPGPATAEPAPSGCRSPCWTSITAPDAATRHSAANRTPLDSALAPQSATARAGRLPSGAMAMQEA